MDRSFFFPQLAGVGGFPADLSSKQKWVTSGKILPGITQLYNQIQSFYNRP
jgi:hypothetical protein